MNHQRVLTVSDLGAAVRRVRRSSGLHQSDLAERLGVTRMTVSRLERGGQVGVETAIRALSECGTEIVIVPKFSRVEVHDD